MPRHADHQQRRQQIAEALLRVAGSRGLHAAGMREVAEEAGVSLRLVQHYFGTKQQLVLFTVQYLSEQLSERVKARVRAAGLPPAPRTIIEAVLTEALPADEETRKLLVVYNSYAALALTDPAFAMEPLIANAGAVEKVLAAQLRAAQEAGQMPSHLDPDAESAILMAVSAGIGTSVIAGARSPKEALGLLYYHLDRLLPAEKPGVQDRRPAAP